MLMRFWDEKTQLDRQTVPGQVHRRTDVSAVHSFGEMAADWTVYGGAGSDDMTDNSRVARSDTEDIERVHIWAKRLDVQCYPSCMWLW